MSMFSVRGAWEALRLRGNEITWYHIVWFSHNIPRHAFNLWLIMRRSLKTQDRVRQWDVGPNVDLNTLCCKLCDAQPDSHEHLFFECPYSARIWVLIRSLGGMELISPRLHDIISYFQPIAHRRNARSVIGRILVAAAAYFIWVERNNHVFKNSRRSPEELCDAIIVTVWLKLLSFCFKNTAAVQDILARWKMPSNSYQMRHVALFRGSLSFGLRCLAWMLLLELYEVYCRTSFPDFIHVMAISVISVSSDSSEDSVGTPAGRVILFGTIPTTIPDTTPVITPPTTQTDTTVIPTEIPIIAPTIPPSPDYTPASPDYSPASDMEFDPSEDPSSDHIPPLPAISPFLSSADDTTDSDTPDTPPSPTHGTPFTETTLSTQRSPTTSGALRRRVMVLAPGQPIPHGRPYRYHLNGPVHMMTARKRVGPLPTMFATSSDSPADALSDSASSRSSSDHSLPASPSGTRSSHRLCSLVPSVHRSSAISERPSHDSSSVSRSRKRSRSPVASVPLSSPTLGALSYARADLLPSIKRIKSLETVEFSGFSEPSRSRGADLEMDVDVVRSDGIEIDLEIQAEIDECFAYVDALRDRWIDARVVVEAADREESETGTKGPVEVRVERVTHHVMPEDTLEPTQERAVEVTYETLGDLVQRFYDHTEAIPVHRVQVIEGAQREQGYRIVGADTAVAILTKRVAELEKDNRRLRGTVSVESQRIDQLQRDMTRMQRELRQIRLF
ncbi:reverse transcriptase domain-containing protein [Tanacetum coccineum]